MKTCAWISRHPPTAEQRKSLADYRIILINPPGRLWSAADAIALSETGCGKWPDLFVVVMPVMMLKRFCELVNGRTPILRSIVKHEKRPTWSPPWEQVIAVHFVTQTWTPDRKETR